MHADARRFSQIFGVYVGGDFGMERKDQDVRPKALTRSDVLVILRQHKQDLAEKYGVTRLGVFGSVAK